MKYTLLILFSGICSAINAQFLITAGPCASYNASGFFKDFKTQYNTLNERDLKNKMGSPSLGLGYSIKIGYKIMGLYTSVGRDRFTASTKASFTNSAKRIIKYDYKFTTANIGYYHSGDRKDFSIELGMIHGIVSQYSFVELPNNQRDFFSGGISANQSWINLGMNLQLNFYKSINDNTLFSYGLQGAFMNNQKDIAPRIKSGNHEATLTFNGILLNAGITFKLGKEID